ncbi:MAG: hypothetical protein ACXWTH_00130, partial [Methylosarcina sp.]
MLKTKIYSRLQEAKPVPKTSKQGYKTIRVKSTMDQSRADMPISAVFFEMRKGSANNGETVQLPCQIIFAADGKLEE